MPSGRAREGFPFGALGIADIPVAVFPRNAALAAAGAPVSAETVGGNVPRKGAMRLPWHSAEQPRTDVHGDEGPHDDEEPAEQAAQRCLRQPASEAVAGEAAHDADACNREQDGPVELQGLP
jgi:hypothetical protein